MSGELDGQLQRWDRQLQRWGVRRMGREADNSCRHCAEWLWLERTASGNDWEWVSFKGVDPKGVAVTSRFCDRNLFPEGTPRREHAPIPTKLKKIDRWLES